MKEEGRDRVIRRAECDVVLPGEGVFIDQFRKARECDKVAHSKRQ